MEDYKVYIRTDVSGRIVAINSSAFISLPDLPGWAEIDSGLGDKYHHAQGNYLPGPLMDERGIYRYKLVGGKVVERTKDEIDADYTPPSETIPIETRLEAIESAIAKIKKLFGGAWTND